MCLRSSVPFTLKYCQKDIITIKSNAEEETILRVPRELIWWCLRKKGVPEGYVTIIQDVYYDCETPVSTRVGHVVVGLHQESALSQLLFILIMDVIQAEIGKEPPWVMLFADDLVIC